MKKRLAGYWDSFSFVGLVVATLLFSASVTPSLLPRNYLVQGLLSGFSLAIGYGVGVGLLWIYRFFELREPSGATQRFAKRVTGGLAAIVFVAFVWRMAFWQNSIRELMEMSRLETAYPYRMALIAVLSGAILVAGGRLFLRCGHFVSAKLQRYIPRRIAHSLGFTLVVFLLLFLTNDVIAARLLDAADSFFLNLDHFVDDDVQEPDDPMLTGSEASLVPSGHVFASCV